MEPLRSPIPFRRPFSVVRRPARGRTRPRGPVGGVDPGGVDGSRCRSFRRGPSSASTGAALRIRCRTSRSRPVTLGTTTCTTRTCYARADHARRPRGAQCAGRDRQRAARGDHIVDEEHRPVDRAPRHHARTDATRGAVATGLRGRVESPQQRTHPEAERPRDRRGEQTGVVEAAGATARVGGRRPRDDDAARRTEGRTERGDDRRDEPVDRGPFVAVLHAGDEFARDPLVLASDEESVERERGGSGAGRAGGRGAGAARTGTGGTAGAAAAEEEGADGGAEAVGRRRSGGRDEHARDRTEGLRRPPGTVPPRAQYR